MCRISQFYHMKRKMSEDYSYEDTEYTEFIRKYYQQLPNTVGSIYVIKYLNANNKYKIGRTTDSKECLVKRYQTHLGKNTFELVYFQKNVKKHEEKEALIHHLLQKI